MTPEDALEWLEVERPFRRRPYVSRAFGNRLHSLCSYQGKLKPGLAHWLVRLFVPEGGRVLDPLGGVGTIAFEAAISGRSSVSSDLSPFAALIARAKLNPPEPDEAARAALELAARAEGITLSKEDWDDAEFGLNAAVAAYYHPDTLAEILRARRLFLSDDWPDRAHAFVWASLLHSLHGNRPYAFSRRSHPLTPFAPSGPAVYRPVWPAVHKRVMTYLSYPLPASFRRGSGLHEDFRSLPHKSLRVFDSIITSPPFLGMRFDRPNWLRLWFCGWTRRDFLETSVAFLERQQVISLDCYDAFFGTCLRLLRPSGLLVLHIGSGPKDDLRRH